MASFSEPADAARPRAPESYRIPRPAPPSRDFPPNGGEMGALMRSLDWSRTPLGATEDWSPALRMMVGFLLANRFPLLLWWGPEYVSIYNDAYRPILGMKHPESMGQPVRECWAEIWHVLQPLIDTPFNGGPPTWMEDLPLEVNRHGFVEETHFTVAYSPVPDETAPRGIGGVLATVHEITEKVVGERRMSALRDLGARAAEARTAEEASAIAAETLTAHSRDIPFALLYLISADGKSAHLAGANGIGMDEPASPRAIDLRAEPAGASGWPIAEAVRSETAQVVRRIGARFAAIPPGPWSDPPHTAVVVPIKSNVARQLAGVLVAGVSPRLRLDDQYRGFLDLVASQIATAVANARAYEEERTRAEALAEIDRAKTAFFSNVSHEFRTPLTLMLAPLEDVLNDPSSYSLSDNQRAQLETAHRNSLRLLKLVNTLLDFSRIEAGRTQATYEPTDLAALTTDLASGFRSAIERAGLTLAIDCAPLPEPVFIDRDMWEKIVLNLLSNAFKFTFEGGVAVSLRAGGNGAVLTVRDTGVGIPENELARVFDRFHRIEGQRSRSFEGSGIGLALVHELIRLHGGAIAARSEPGKGTEFSVTIPFGAAHVPQGRIGAARTMVSTATRVEAFVEEAMRWLPELDAGGPELVTPAVPAGAVGAPRPAVLLADDNADMRDYVRRLLQSRYDVVAVADGEAALAAIRTRRPDLLISDVMMPRLDGFGLLRAIRADPVLRDLPVILLSARAGEEARADGLDTGADDYLTKPFSARELLARVGANIAMAHVRDEAAMALREESNALEILNRTGARIAAELDLEKLVQVVVDAGVQLTGAQFGAFFYNLSDEAGERYTLYTLSGAPRDAFASFPMPRNTGVFGPTFRGGTVRSGDITKNPRYGKNPPYCGMPKGHLPVRSYLAVPVVSRSGEVIGGLFFGHEKTGVFTDRAERLMTGLSAQAAIGIDNARLFQDVQRLNERLEIRVAERTAELRDALAQLQREAREREQTEEALRQSHKMEAIGQLTGGIAHDFNNLLAGIVGSLELMQLRLAQGRTGELGRYISAASTAASRAGALTHRLLAFARRQALDPKPTNVNKLVSGMEELIRRTVGPAIAAETVLAAGLWPTLCDANQLESALLNLCINARDAMANGGRLTIETANADLDAPYAATQRDVRPGQYVSLSVTDTGIGMSANVLTRAFEPFFTTKPVGQGTGLGLSMLYGFVKQSGGHARIYSEPGQGTTVRIYLPRHHNGDAHAEPAVAAEAGSEDATSAAAGETVLVVEDEPVVRALIVEILSDLGYTAMEAADGPAGLRILRSTVCVDLLITDVGLPGMNGRQFAETARQRQPGLKVLFITGYAHNAALGNELLAPGMEMVAKPFALDALAAKIRAMIER